MTDLTAPPTEASPQASERTRAAVLRATELLEADPRSAEVVATAIPMVSAAGPQLAARGEDPWMYAANLYQAIADAWVAAQREYAQS